MKIPLEDYRKINKINAIAGRIDRREGRHDRPSDAGDSCRQVKTASPVNGPINSGGLHHGKRRGKRGRK
jgi:hypothetical protein